MKVLKEGIHSFEDHNQSYNTVAEPIIGDFLQTDDEGPIGYVHAQTSQRHAAGWKPNAAVTKLVRSAYRPPLAKADRFDVGEIGEYERVVFSCLAWGEYNTYVLVGEMGSGKTATTNHVRKLLEKPRLELCGDCTACDPVIIAMDLNEGFNNRNTERLLVKFRQFLFEKLRRSLRDVFRKNNLTDKLLQTLASRPAAEDLEGFDRFLQSYEDNKPEWTKKTQHQKANLLFSFVDEETGKGKDPELIMRLVRFVKKNLRADAACFVLIFDNIDSIWPEAQYDLLVEILSLQRIARARALVVLRRSTFQRLDNQAAYSFGCIQHVGPEATEIIKARLRHYDQQWDADRRIQALSTGHKDAMYKRLRYMLETSEGEHAPLTLLSPLWGASVRLGLHLVERAFSNVTIPYDKDPGNRADLVRAVMTWGRGEGVEADDPCIVNLFLNKATGTASLLNVRILQLVAALEHHNERRNVATLYSILKVLHNWTGDEIRDAINYLLYMRHPLLWVEGKAIYESVKHMQDCNDILYLTESGAKYLKSLLGDLVYVQEAMSNVDWQITNLPASVNYASPLARFQVLRLLFGRIMEEDLEQISNFIDWQKGSENEPLPIPRPILITNRMLNSIGHAVLNILTSVKPEISVEIKAELRSWLSCINTGLNNEVMKIGGRYSKLEQLSKRYEKEIAQIGPDRRQ